MLRVEVTHKSFEEAVGEGGRSLLPGLGLVLGLRPRLGLGLGAGLGLGLGLGLGGRARMVRVMNIDIVDENRTH